MFSPDDDLSAVWRRLIGDAELLDLLGLTSASLEQISDHIIKENRWQDLADGKRRLNIYFRSARRTGNQSVLTDVLQVDCHVPSTEGHIANKVQRRVKGLLHAQWLNNKAVTFAGQLGELPTMPGFVCVGSRFTWPTTID